MSENEKMVIESGDHTSRRLLVNGYPVVLRFTAEPHADLFRTVKNMLLFNRTLDRIPEVWENERGGEPSSGTLKTEYHPVKILTDTESEEQK